MTSLNGRFIAVALLLGLFSHRLFGQTATSSKPTAFKVVVVTMFERGDDIGARATTWSVPRVRPVHEVVPVDVFVPALVELDFNGQGCCLSRTSETWVARRASTWANPQAG